MKSPRRQFSDVQGFISKSLLATSKYSMESDNFGGKTKKFSPQKLSNENLKVSKAVSAGDRMHILVRQGIKSLTITSESSIEITTVTVLEISALP